MLAINFTFTAHRYHATQWGRHVNEGVPEWPPSPWRILRGIVATWRRTLPDIPRDCIEPILGALASEYPKFHLPHASTGHTRHYMPTGGSPNLVIDSFIAIQPESPVFVVWPNVELDSQQRGDLERILRNMPYLGRAESWVEAGIATDPPDPNSYALESELPKGDWDVVRTLVPRSPITLEELEVETSELRGGGRIDPEGAHWYPYVRKRDCFTAFRTTPTTRPARDMRSTVVRFALSGKVLPMTSDTLRWGEAARDAAMSHYGGRQNKTAQSPTLSGKDESGGPLKGHQHAFYLPTDENGDGRLDHLMIWAPGELHPEEFQAVVSVPELSRGGGRDPLRLVYQAHGLVDDFEGVSDLCDKSKKWRSLTPYILPRHRKRTSDSPEEQVMREISLRWPDKTVRVNIEDPRKPIAPMQRGRSRSDGFRPFDFFRYRKRGSSGGGAFNFELEFDEPVRGPVALGFACHYGLGLFVPWKTSSTAYKRC